MFEITNYKYKNNMVIKNNKILGRYNDGALTHSKVTVLYCKCRGVLKFSYNLQFAVLYAFFYDFTL